MFNWYIKCQKLVELPWIITIKQLVASETNPNSEVLFWLDVIQLSRTVYMEKFILPQSIQSLCGDKKDCSNEKQLLKDYVSDCIKKKNIASFQFATLCADTQVQHIAKKMLSQHSDDREVRKFFYQAKTLSCSWKWIWSLQTPSVFFSQYFFKKEEILRFSGFLTFEISVCKRQVN